MRERGRGRIGVITSLGGLISAPHLLPYSTAKFGAVGFTRGLRSELSGTGVSVTSVGSGLMRTGSHLRAKFVGNQAREYSWFGTAASFPLLSMDAERAAARIVRGMLRGQSWSPYPLAQIAPRVDALFPRAPRSSGPDRPVAARRSGDAGERRHAGGLGGRQEAAPTQAAHARPGHPAQCKGRGAPQRRTRVTALEATRSGVVGEYLLDHVP